MAKKKHLLKQFVQAEFVAVPSSSRFGSLQEELKKDRKSVQLIAIDRLIVTMVDVMC